MSLTRQQVEYLRIHFVLPFIRSRREESDVKREFLRAFTLFEAELNRLQPKDLTTAPDQPSFLKFNNRYSEEFKQLGAMYLDSLPRPAPLENATPVGIRTCIRELFFEYMQPTELRCLHTGIIGNDTATAIDVRLYNNFFPAQIERRRDLFYALGNEVKITKPRPFIGGSDMGMCLRDNVSQKELIDSFCDESLTEVILFESLYQAIEYTVSRQHGGTLESREEDGYIPTLWAVTLTSKEQGLPEPQIAVCSSDQEVNDYPRDAEVAYRKIPKSLVTPMVGTVFYPSRDPLHYHVFARVNHRDVNKKAWDERMQEERGCRMM